MKYIAIIIIIFSSLNLSSQKFDIFLSNPLEWKNYSANIDTVLRRALIHRFFRTTDYNQHSSGLDYESFHFMELNNDNEIDLIYEGRANSEGTRIMIYFQNSDGFVEAGEFFGKILELQFSDNKIHGLTIYDYPCCAGYVGHIQEYSFDKTNQNFRLDDQMAFLTGTLFPDKKTIDQRFSTKNDSYRLRTDPVIDNQEYDDNDRPFKALGNIVGEFQLNSTGRAIAEKTDDTGRIWWFVIMDSENHIDNSLFYKPNNNELPYKTLGWMSSRYIEKMEKQTSGNSGE